MHQEKLIQKPPQTPLLERVMAQFFSQQENTEVQIVIPKDELVVVVQDEVDNQNNDERLFGTVTNKP
jgi:hypothetical protein